MENVTGGGLTEEIQLIEYEVAVMMMTVVPPLILVLGAFGNVATILVMCRIKNNNSSQYPIFVVLALADLSLLYSGLLTDWLWVAFQVNTANVHTVICKLYNWVILSSNTTSAWLVTTLTVQRTMAVLWPHRMRVMCTVRRTWIIIAVVVVTAWSVHLHCMIAYHLVENIYCGTEANYRRFLFLIWARVDMYISSLIPFVCLLVCSVILSWALFKSNSLSRAVHAESKVRAGHSHDNRKSDTVKVVVMVLALSCTFLLLTSPLCMYTVWSDLHYSNKEYVQTSKAQAMAWIFQSLTILMWYSNSAVNFLLYCITGARFRKEFRSLLCCGIKGHTGGETTAVTSSGGGSKRMNCTPLSA